MKMQCPKLSIARFDSHDVIATSQSVVCNDNTRFHGVFTGSTSDVYKHFDTYENKEKGYSKFLFYGSDGMLYYHFGADVEPYFVIDQNTIVTVDGKIGSPVKDTMYSVNGNPDYDSYKNNIYRMSDIDFITCNLHY